jgi:hypothetical protein
MTFEIKDSGERKEYDSGMVRDTQDGKPMFGYLFPEGVPYDEQFLTRCAQHMTKGFEKYGHRNWEKANSSEEVERFRNSAMRHLVAWTCGLRDEDHAAAVVFNLIAAETTRYKIDHPKQEYTIEKPITIGDLQIGVITTTNMQPGSMWIGPAHPEYIQPEGADGPADEGQPVNDYTAGTKIRQLGYPQSQIAVVVVQPGPDGIGHATYVGGRGITFRFDVANWIVVEGV